MKKYKSNNVRNFLKAGIAIGIALALFIPGATLTNSNINNISIVPIVSATPLDSNFTMTVENTSAIQGTQGHSFKINGTFSEDIMYYQARLEINPVGNFVVTGVTFDDCVGVPDPNNYMVNDYGNYLTVLAYYDPGDEVPAGGGTLFNIVVDIDEDASLGMTYLDFNVSGTNTMYYDADFMPRIPEVVNGHLDIILNNPPDTPSQPTGPTIGDVGVEYTYSTSSISDPEDHQVQYRFDWGDEQYSGWTSLMDPGQIASQSHLWMYPGFYEVRAKARDELGATSEWSDSLTVNVSSGIDLWWPMFHHDLSNKGCSTSPAPDLNNIKWISSTDGSVSSSPAVVTDDRVFICSEDGKIYCFDAETGNELFNKSIGGSMKSSPTVVDDRVYVGSYDNKVYCLDASDGTELWNFPTGDDVHSSPAVAYGNVYIGSNDNKIYCLDASDGTKKWEFVTGDDVYSSPAVVDDRVYVGSYDHKVYCLDASDGTELWNYTEGSDVRSSPAVVDGKVYFAGTFNVHCLYASNGTKIWDRSSGVAGPDIKSSPAVAYGKVYIGVGYVGVGYRGLFCLDAEDGTILWSSEVNLNYGVYSSPAVAEGKVYFGANDNNVYCFNASTGAILWDYTTGGDVVSSPAIAYGKVYIGSNDGNVYCFTEENEPPNKPRTPEGPDTGEVAESLCFNTSTTDPDGNQVRYGWDWDGDGVVDTWTDFYDSGINVTTCHQFDSGGVFDIKVKAEDIHGAQSNWSDILTVTIINEPPNPPLQPVGPTAGVAGFEYTFSTNTTDPEGHAVQYLWDWDGDGVVDNWTNYYQSGVAVETSHIWNAAGTFDIQVKAKDQYGAIGNWSEPLTITITNEAPETPDQPEGRTQGVIDVEYDFSTSTTDPDGHQVRYGWDWNGNDSVDEWTDYYNSGAAVTTKHIWTEAGTYDIKVKADDGFGGVSDWSSIHTIYIQEGVPDLAIGEIKGGLLQVSAEIKNIGEGAINDIDWNITVTGGILGLIDVYANGTIDVLSADGVETVSTIDHGKIFGLGPVDIIVTASAPDVDPITKEATARVFGPFVFGVTET